jgi:hypothetical protein
MKFFKNMFGQSPLEKWYDSLPEHTKAYLSNQPVWHDRDMFQVAVLFFVVGLVIGLIF